MPAGQAPLAAGAIPPHAVAADKELLASLNNTYGLLPDFYRDLPFRCRGCGGDEVWTAKQQKWWYEVAQGNINSTAMHCRACRRLEKARVDEARRVSEAGRLGKAQSRPQKPLDMEK